MPGRRATYQKLWSWCAMPILYLGIYGLASVIRQKIAGDASGKWRTQALGHSGADMLQHTHLQPTVDLPAADVLGQGGAGELVDFASGSCSDNIWSSCCWCCWGDGRGDPSRCRSSNLHC